MTEMPNDLNTISATDTDLFRLKQELAEIVWRLDKLQGDIRYLKEIFVRKEQKRERRRQKREQERLALEQEKREEQDRRTYEQIVRALKVSPWDLMPAPPSRLSPKEFQLVSLLARYKTDGEVAKRMDIDAYSVPPRICAANKKLGLSSREELVAYYLEYLQILRTHRHDRCLRILSWLLDPPTGYLRYRLKLVWKRNSGRPRMFKYIGPYIPADIFDRLQNYKHAVLKLMARGFTYSETAKQLKINEDTVRSYFSEIRSHIKWRTGPVIISEMTIIALYKEYLKKERLRKYDK